MENKNSAWPLYRKELLEVGNLNSSTGLCCLWTPKNQILEKVSKDNFILAGQCYSRCEGPSLIVRHVLANKKIHRIVICGLNLNKVADTLIALKENGVDENYNIIGIEGAEIEKEIPIEAINRFRENVEIIDKRDEKDFNELNKFLETLESKDAWGESEIYERLPPKRPESYPSEKTGFIVRGKTVGDVWLEILDTIIKFGHVKKSKYAEDQQEIPCLVSVVSDEDPDNVAWKPYFKFDKDHLEKYYPQLMSGEIVEGVSYTYGSRLRNFKGINQIDFIVNSLKKMIYSRKAVAVLWDVEKDITSGSGPCLDLIQALSQEKLHMTAYIRSNDMFQAWPENAFALRKVQYEIAEKVGVPVGDLIIISNSAHIYESNWDKAKKVLADNPIPMSRDSDPRGNILINLEEGKIKITHLSPDGVRLNEFLAENSKQALRKLVQNKMISQTSHAIDIGIELGKAETALREGREYVQDHVLS